MPYNTNSGDKLLKQILKKEKDAFAKRRAEALGLNFADLSKSGIDPESLYLIPEEKVRSLKIAPFKLNNKDLYIGALDPEKPSVKEEIKKLKGKGYEPHLFVISENGLERVLSYYKDLRIAKKTGSGIINIKPENFDDIADKIKTRNDMGEFIRSASDLKKGKITRILEILFAGSIKIGASDIHIEPNDTDAEIRIRIDGILHEVAKLDARTYKLLNSRIKILSKLKITNTSIGQDGRFTVSFRGREIEVRVSTVPSAYGETIVMRLLDPEGLTLKFEELGFNENLLKIIKKEISKPNGLILTTGPTGSGKTTTLYSFLKYVQSDEKKIITIEDPIEYHLEGITQTPVQKEKGYGFADGLRHALRQDPEIIMVGEIRDEDTASSATDAALTGHMVFSTLHTNNSAGAIPRLLDLNVKKDILVSSLTVAMAQRLLRRLCDKCKIPTVFDKEQKDIVKKISDIAKMHGKEIGFDIDNEEIKIYKASENGCEACSGVGYKGRIGVYEAILMDENVEKVVFGEVSERNIWRASAKQGILNMAEDGIAKVVRGITSFEEYAEMINYEEYIEMLDVSGGEDENIVGENPETIENITPINSKGEMVEEVWSGATGEPADSVEGVSADEIPNEIKTSPKIGRVLSGDIARIAYAPSKSPKKEMDKIIDMASAMEESQRIFGNINPANEKLKALKSKINNLAEKCGPSEIFQCPHNDISTKKILGIINDKIDTASDKYESGANAEEIARRIRDIKETLKRLRK